MQDYSLKTKVGAHDICVLFQFSKIGYCYPMILVTTNQREGFSSELVDLSIGDGMYQTKEETEKYFNTAMESTIEKIDSDLQQCGFRIKDFNEYVKLFD